MDVCLTDENVYDIIVNKMGWKPIDAASFLQLAVKAQKETDITMPAWVAEVEDYWFVHLA